MDSLQEILGKKDFTPPDEVQALRDYVKRRYGSESSVKVQRDAVILSVPNSALAGTLQMERNQIIEKCKLTSKLVIRMGRYS
ncbi:MAG: hypothetical protein JWO96_256 [Candidatus Saccharibacteria bacterium]|nr:hypothetical protein [Candidatus Saccharibacteria bacterium]